MKQVQYYTATLGFALLPLVPLSLPDIPVETIVENKSESTLLNATLYKSNITIPNSPYNVIFPIVFFFLPEL